MAWRSSQRLRRWRVALAAGAVAFVLAGCATPGLPARGGNSGEVARQEIAGRLSLVQGTGDTTRALYGGFSLVLQGDTGTFDVFSPIGQMLAKAAWSAHAASVDDGRSVRTFPDFSAMTEAALGVALPRAALQDWIRGRPAAGLPSQALPDGAFQQLGWTVRPVWSDGRLTLLTAERGGDAPAQLRMAITAQAAVAPVPAASIPSRQP